MTSTAGKNADHKKTGTVPVFGADGETGTVPVFGTNDESGAAGDVRAGGLCSELAARRGLPLIGSAGSYDAILAFELPPPWTAKLAGSRASDPLLDAAMHFAGKQNRKVRLLALEPEASGGLVRVLWLPKDPANAAGFLRREYEVPRADLPRAIENLAAEGETRSKPICGDERRDILVCTHGARDACCGKFGYPIYRELRRLAGDASPGTAQVRIWRTSHLGGHRFAPTLLDLPSGRMFGRLSLEDAGAVLGGGQRLVDRLAQIYRGRCSLPEAAQIVERNLWRECGPDFESAALSWTLDAPVNAPIDAAAGGPFDALVDCWQVEMRVQVERQSEKISTVRVTRAMSLAVTTPPSCGRDAKTESPWEIVD